MRRSRLADVAIMIGMLIGAWAIRALSADAFVTWDEPAWVFRSVKFLIALSQGRFTDTLLVGHPGVVTMWSGALSLLWHRLVTGAVTPAQLAAVDSWAAFQVHDLALLRELSALLPWAKSGVLILQAALVAAAYGLMRTMLARRYALAAAFFLALDPYYLALSRVLHIDALVSGFMLLSLLSLLVFVRRGRRAWLVLSGTLLGLAVLTKAYGAFVAVPALTLLACHHLVAFRRQQSGSSSRGPAQAVFSFLRDALMWGLAALVTFVVLWPAMWTAPLDVVRTMVGLSLEYATAPGDATALFFRGQSVEQVGAAFYVVALLFRATPLALIGSTLALLVAMLPSRLTGMAGGRRLTILTLWGFAISYLVLVTLAEKKFDRYVLPALLPLDVAASFGIVGSLEAVMDRLRPARWRARARDGMVMLLPSALVLTQAALLSVPVFPSHYLAYYNPLAGGLPRALRTLPVGWGEGLEAMSSYLADKPDSETLTVAAWGIAGLAGGFPGGVVTPTDENLPAADYVLLYISDVQTGGDLVARFTGAQLPEHVVRVAGSEYAWLYRNDYDVDLRGMLEGAALPGDAIVTNRESTFAQSGLGALPLLQVEGQTEAEIAGALEGFRKAQALSVGQRILMVRFHAKGLKLTWLDRQLAQNGLFLWERPFDYGVVQSYQLIEGAAFHQVQAVAEESIVFGDSLRLWGYGLAAPSAQYRQRIGIALGFQALKPIEDDLHVFVHLVDERGSKWGQRDAPLLSESLLRTSDWAPGVENLVNLAMPLTPGVVPGTYTLVMGVYRLGDLSRLEAQVVAGGGSGWIIPGAGLALTTVEVLPAEIPPDVGDLEMPHHVEAYLGSHTEVLGYALSAGVVSPGDEVELTLWWRCLEPLAVDRDLSVVLVQGDTKVQLLQAKPAGPYYTTETWRAGDVLRYPHRFAIPGEMPGGAYDLSIDLRSAEAQQRPSDADAGITLTQVTVDSPERMVIRPDIQAPMSATLGNEIAFLGYALEATSVAPGGDVALTLYWQAQQRPQASYTVFTHLLRPDGQVHSQVDALPMSGQRPTLGWMAGEYIVDRYLLPVSLDTLAGQYAIEVGMYDAATGSRLSVEDANGHKVPDRRILLDRTVQVTAP